MFRKILIANRGEVAVRVIRTARAMGVRTVAVYSEADREAPHVWLADEAYPIGPAPAAVSYLVADSILDAARRSGAEAIHPGYGFLAEDPAFAEAVHRRGLTFIGPSPETLRLTGDKAAARRRMLETGVPVVPGSEGVVSSAEEARRVGREIGFPVLLKPAGGGGGKGMRLVHEPAELEREFAAASREAAKAFDNPELYVERHLGRVRHLEVQVLGTAGGVVALGERECSIQRRHQKLVEETPSPATVEALSAAVAQDGGRGRRPHPSRRRGDAGPRLRERLLQAGVHAAQAVGYRNAGTVEFLLDTEGGIHFIEINARLQVEHPVTELVTGLDLVEAQLAIAACEPLSPSFASVQARGWAMEVRVCAEDPEREFLPVTGTVRALRLPGGPHVRWDGGIEDGTVVSPHYDSLLGKLAAWGEDRAAAAARLAAALDEMRIEGLATNLAFLRRVVRDDRFRAGQLHTRFVQERRELLSAGPPARPERLAVAAAWAQERAAATRPAAGAATNGGAGPSAWRTARLPFLWYR